MAEADHRRAQRLAGLQRRVAGRIGIARLDQGRALGQRAGSAQRLTLDRPAVAVAERQLRARMVETAAPAASGTRARHHKGVAHARPRPANQARLA